MSGRKYHVHYSSEALSDLRDIYSYIAFELGARAVAKNQTGRIREEIKSLNQFPDRYEGVPWEPWHSMGVRKVPVDNYVVYYLPDKDTLEVGILRIFYGGRDVENIINEIE